MSEMKFVSYSNQKQCSITFLVMLVLEIFCTIIHVWNILKKQKTFRTTSFIRFENTGNMTGYVTCSTIFSLCSGVKITFMMWKTCLAICLYYLSAQEENYTEAMNTTVERYRWSASLLYCNSFFPARASRTWKRS